MILRANSPADGRYRWVELADRRRGLPEGNGLSPFLSNLYVTGIARALEHLNYFRYADDILMLTKCPEEPARAAEFLSKLFRRAGLALNLNKTDAIDLHKTPLVYLGYEIRGGNLYPSQKAILRLKRKLRVRGLEARQKVDLMKGFVTRFEIGSVRKLFRRVDRGLRQYYPGGETLVGILDRRAGARGSEAISQNWLSVPSTGKAARLSSKNPHRGRPPLATQPGSRVPTDLCSPAQKKESYAEHDEKSGLFGFYSQ
jgi:hypothetical protein